MASSLECHAVLDNREKEPPPTYSKCHQNLKTPQPSSSSEHNPLDNANFLSSATAFWMTPLLWAMYKNQETNSMRLSPFDGADANGERLQGFWKEEVAKVGMEKASLVRMVLRFQRTRLLQSVFNSFVLMFCTFMGPGVLVFEILSYVSHPEATTVTHGGSLCLALFFMECSKVFFNSLLWMTNLRTTTRIKSACAMMGFQKILSLRVESGISIGEVPIGLYSY